MNHTTLPLLSAVAALLFAPFAASAKASPKLGVVGSARYHQEHSTVAEWPFDKGDMSYGASLLLYDGMGYIELGCEYCPDPTAEKDAIDDVITPFARLVVSDLGFTAGFGVRDNYVFYADKDRKDDWSDLLYEFHLGLEFTFAPIVIGGGAYYSFDDWDDLKDFDVDDLEYGIHAGFCF